MSTLVQNILIVDDFAADRELYRRSLLTDSRSTYHPIEAESVAEGLELCTNHQIDAVLLDYMLPDGDGLEFLAALSELHRDHPPPVVMMTGQGSEKIAVRAMKLGAQDYLVKREVTPAILQITMRTAIENARLKRQLAQCQARFRISIDNMRECVSIFAAIRDDAGHIIDFRFDYLNPAALENNRMTARDIGRSLCEVFPAFRASGLFEEYCQLVETGQPLIKEDLVYEDVFAGERLRRTYSIHATKLDDGFVSCWRDETSKRATEQQLEAADLKIIEIWESMTDAYVTVDRDWRLVYANQAATQVICHLTNLAPTEFLGRSHWDLFPSLVGTDVEREFRHALTERVAVHMEVWFEPTASWFESHLYPAAEGLGIYFRDISLRKQLEAERIAAEQERDRFFNLSIDLLAIGNFDGYFTRLNPAWEKVLGFTNPELMSRPFFEFIHPDDVESTRVAVQRGLNEGFATASFENRYRCKDGSYRWLSWSTMPLPELNLMYGIAHDITDRKREEAQLLQAQATIGQQLGEIEAIYQNAPIGLCFIDVDFRFVRINQQLAQINGLSVNEHIGRTLREILPDLADTLEPLFRQLIKSGQPIHNLEISGTTQAQAGVERYWLVSYYPQIDDRDRTIGINAMVQEITDRKQMEAERLSATQERDRFFNLSIDLLAIANFDGYFTRLNPAFERILGFTHAELTTRPFLDFVHPEDRATTVAATQQLSAGEVLVSFENRYRCQDGSYRWLLWSAIPDLEQNLIYASGHDITDRQQAEESLRQSERKFTAIFEQSFELMGIVSLDGVLLEVNQTALNSIAARREDIAGKLFWETPWWHTEQLQQQLQDSIDRASRGEFIRYEVQFAHPSGVTLTTDFSLKPVFDDAGKVSTIVAEAHDITERKRAERELAESEERLLTGIEVAGVGLARFDYATNLVSLSPEAAALFGFAPDELVVTREQIHNTFHPDERAELEAIIATVVDPAGTGWFARDHRVVWPNGEVRCLSVRKQVFFDRVGAVGCPSYAILAAIDITDRKQTQSDLEARNQELDSFVHIVSHDLKAPLRAVSNLSKWIEEDLDGSLPATTQAQMNLLRGRIERMSATIDGLLDYARIGRTSDSIEPVAVGELIAETIETLAPPPTFTIAIAKNLPTLQTKRLPISQVFANLIGNAIKHHDRVDGAIHIGIAERSDVYEFAIADDGPGIAPEFQARIFNIFQAVNPQNRNDSTGIGLAIVKKIVEAEGGTIRLESQPGRGTTFYFTWPKRSERG